MGSWTGYQRRLHYRGWRYRGLSDPVVQRCLVRLVCHRRQRHRLEVQHSTTFVRCAVPGQPHASRLELLLRSHTQVHHLQASQRLHWTQGTVRRLSNPRLSGTEAAGPWWAPSRGGSHSCPDARSYSGSTSWWVSQWRQWAIKRHSTQVGLAMSFSEVT